MTLSCTCPPNAGPPAAPRTPPGDDCAARRQQHPGDRQRGEDFERLLREKAARHEEEDESPAVDLGPGAAAVLPAFVVAMPLPMKHPHGEGPAAGDAAGGASHDASPTAKQAAQAAATDAPPPLGAPANASGAWELTLRQPLAAAVDVRATRNAEAANGWSLSIASPTLDASLLARHAPRLNERLKARALSNTHVRIEERDEEDLT